MNKKIAEALESGIEKSDINNKVCAVIVLRNKILSIGNNYSLKSSSLNKKCILRALSSLLSRRKRRNNESKKQSYPERL